MKVMAPDYRLIAHGGDCSYTIPSPALHTPMPRCQPPQSQWFHEFPLFSVAFLCSVVSIHA
jgi:hypothetical protein